MKPTTASGLITMSVDHPALEISGPVFFDLSTPPSGSRPCRKAWHRTVFGTRTGEEAASAATTFALLEWAVFVSCFFFCALEPEAAVGAVYMTAQDYNLKFCSVMVCAYSSRFSTSVAFYLVIPLDCA